MQPILKQQYIKTRYCTKPILFVLKPVIVLLACVFQLYPIFAQVNTKPVKGNFSFNISLSDYSFLKTVKDSSFNNAIKQKDWARPGKQSFGFGISYWRMITGHIDFSGNFTTTFSSFPEQFVKNDSIGNAAFTPQLDALLHFKATKAKATVVPFLTAGIGAGYFYKNLGLYAPLGSGLSFHFNEGATIILQAQARIPITPGITSGYMFYSLGLSQLTVQKNTSPKKHKTTVKPAIEKKTDTDGDGIADTEDACPTEKGTVKGCPDKDGDGIADKDDKCPGIPGLLRYFGCPIPDTDNDGINDEVDHCPKASGPKENNGCPYPDADNDGVPDKDDKCPTVAGKAEYKGCPQPIIDGVAPAIIDEDSACYRIYFDFTEDKLTVNAFSTLRGIVNILKADPGLIVKISGHSDSQGTPTNNMRISVSRSSAVRQYFLSYGIAASRIITTAYGAAKPLDPQQQWRNRRADICVIQKTGK